ncbi:hypothetical protein MRX96_000072 [Rhipicephalus microplus]
MEEANHNEATQRSSSPNPVLVCRPRSTCAITADIGTEALQRRPSASTQYAAEPRGRTSRPTYTPPEDHC